MTRLYRLLLAAYPRQFREHHGPEMIAAVEDGWRHARAQGFGAAASFLARLLADFARSLPAAWRPSRQAHRPLPYAKDPIMRMLLRDLHLAARVLWRARASNGAIVLTLALGIGANAAVFSVVNAVLLKPLPYAQPDRLVMVWERNVPRHIERNVVSVANFFEWQARARSFTGLAGFARDTGSLTGDGAPEDLAEYAVSWNFFDLIGSRPAIGRAFLEAESVDGSPRAAMLSWSVWQRRYNGDPAVVGRSITLDGLPRTVVGILPDGFHFLGNRADVWVPFRFTAQSRQPTGRGGMKVIGRLAPGVSVAEANAEMDVIARALEHQWPQLDTGWRISVVSLQDDLTGSLRLPLLLLLATVGVVLLVGCANVSNLLLARAAERQREMAVRAALGASRMRLLRQLLMEGLVLAGTGALGGLLVAQASLSGVLHWLSASLGIPRVDEAQLNGPVLLFSLALMGLCALAFSAAPALRLSADGLTPALAAGGRWSTAGRAERRVRQGLVVIQVAFAVMLVVGSGLLTRSFLRLTSISPGFDPADVLTFTLSLPSARYPDGPAGTRFFEQALDGVRAIPGVEGAGAIAFLPFTGLGAATSFTIVGHDAPPRGQEPVADIRPVDDEYFRVMRIPLLRGRAFTHDEVVRGPHVAIINESAARTLFEGEDPIGRSLDVAWSNDRRPDEIVGVVGDVKHDSLKAAVRPMIYYPYGRSPIGFASLVIRGGGSGVIHSATSVVQALDKDLPLTDVAMMSDRIGQSIASPSLAAALVSAFAGLALLLSLVGIAALLAASVASRTAEIGIRAALGARPAQVRRLVLGQAAGLVGAGLALGLAGAAAGARAVASLLYDVRPLDPVVYVGAAVILAALALAAADIPARRATRIDPARTLR